MTVLLTDSLTANYDADQGPGFGLNPYSYTQILAGTVLSSQNVQTSTPLEQHLGAINCK